MESEAVFVDTNVFLRFLIKDVLDQAEAAHRLFQQAGQGSISLVTTSMVVAEVVWTLESFYKETKEDIQPMVLSFLNTPGLEVEGGDLIIRALLWYIDKNIDFIDAYNAAWMENHGITTIYTFDRNHFSRLGGMKVLAPGE